MARYLTSRDLAAAAAKLAVPVATIRALTEIESNRSGYLGQSDLPKILFEGHVFHRLTGGTFADDFPNLSYPKWTKAFYQGGRAEYDRLLAAVELDLEAALQATSWGLFQIMGFNHQACGFGSVRDYVNTIAESEGQQLQAFVGFIATNGLADLLKRQDWVAFARRYNGPGYQQNQYDTKLAAAFARARREAEDGGPMAGFDSRRGDVAALQAALNAAIDAGLTVDGWWGPATRTAVIRFQQVAGLPPSGEVDRVLLAHLGLDDA